MILATATGAGVNATLAVPQTYASTPLIFFPPELAYRISVEIYIHVGCLAVLLWDIIDNLQTDFVLLFLRKIKLPTVIYFVSRITLVVYMLIRTILFTLPVEKCAQTYDAANVLLVVFLAATTAMFYLRVCAVYNMRRAVIVSCGVLWIGVVGMLLTLPFTFTAAHIATTQYCGEVMRGPFLGPVMITLMVYDMVVYVAIAYRIFSVFSASDTKRISTVLTFGKPLPAVSRALYKDSQMYFMVVVVTNPIIVAFAYAYEAPLNIILLVCHLVLVNILSCRVYRNLRMGVPSDDPTSKLVFRQDATHSHPRSTGNNATVVHVTTTRDSESSIDVDDGSKYLDAGHPSSAVFDVERGLKG